MHLLQVVCIVCAIIIIGSFIQTMEKFQSDSYTIKNDIGFIFSAGGNYEDYTRIAQVQLDPWHFVKILKLAKKGILTHENINTILQL